VVHGDVVYTGGEIGFSFSCPSVAHERSETMMPLRVVMSMLFIGSCLCSPTLLAEEHTQDTVPEVIAAVKEKKAVLVDVREKSEWDKDT
jgi:hypothetical protein